MAGGKDASPPQTPQSRNGSKLGKNSRALTVNTGLRETFLDEITPVDPSLSKGNVPDRLNRDSHDLSLSPRQVTRDSLVDHMLLSLDQFSFHHDLEHQPTVDEEQLYAEFGEDEHYQPTQNFAPRNGNGRGPTHNYSYSSDYEVGDDSSRYSGQLSRGRRSNSSSNIPIQSGMGKFNHIRNESIPSSTFNKGPPIQIPPRGLHSRSGKGSKGSSTNSFDLGYAQVTGSQRWGHALPGRSSSFDYGDHQSSTMSRQNNGTFHPADYDAAPTPTIPGGPRRTRPASPITLPKQPPQPAESSHKLERKRSTRSSKSAYKKKASPSGGRVDYGLNDHSRELPPLPAFLNEQPAPAPLVGYGKSKDLPAVQPKERPGFFRRVFGSSRSASTPVSDPPPSHGSTTSTETTDRPTSKTNHIANQIKPKHAVQPSRELPPPPKEHVLIKKPSSFFRRRKKSVSEPEQPMPLPVVPPIKFQPEIESKNGQSPVSSLRKVMNPYLRSPGKSLLDPQHPQHQFNREQMNPSPEHEDHSTSFSPEYERDKTATIRAVRPSSRDGDVYAVTSHSPSEKSAPNANPPAMKPGYLGLDGHMGDDQDATFLQDSSDNDPEARVTVSKTTTSPRESKVPVSTLASNTAPAAPSVARDMALVAEYERVHSKRSPIATKLKSDATKSSPDTRGSKPNHINKSNAAKTAGWVNVTPTKVVNDLDKDKENRIWLEPSDSDEEPRSATLEPPNESVNAVGKISGSTETTYKSATSLPIFQVEGENKEEPETPQPILLSAAEAIKSLDQDMPDTENTADGDRERAKKIYDGKEDFIQKDKAAAWLGEEGVDRTRILVAYMELYDFTNINILVALRAMCGRLVLRAESQQVDRILDAFAKRWCQCNPNHGFKVTGEWNVPVLFLFAKRTRCCAHHLLFDSPFEHRSSSSRY
jgi:hypothetical protein